MLTPELLVVTFKVVYLLNFPSLLVQRINYYNGEKCAWDVEEFCDYSKTLPT